MPEIKPYLPSHTVYRQIGEATQRVLAQCAPGEAVYVTLLADGTSLVRAVGRERLVVKETAACDVLRLERQLDELASLHPDVALRLVDERSPRHYRDTAFCYKENTRLCTSDVVAGRYLSADTQDPGQRELFIVDQHASGASAKHARDRHTQAVLTVDRTALTLTRLDREAMLLNKALAGMFWALGTGIVQDESFDISHLQYREIILLMGTDLEGLRLQAVVLACLDHYTPELIAAGRVFLAHAPRYRAQLGDGWTTWFFHDQTALLSFQKELHPIAYKQLRVTPCQGLAELDAGVLGAAAMNPASRHLEQVQATHITGAWALLDALDNAEGQIHGEMADFLA